MKYSVRFRFNKVTGEVEEFIVDQETHLSSPEHNRLHDANTRELANLLARFHEIEELSHDHARTSIRATPPVEPEQDEEAPTRDSPDRADRTDQ